METNLTLSYYVMTFLKWFLKSYMQSNMHFFPAVINTEERNKAGAMEKAGGNVETIWALIAKYKGRKNGKNDQKDPACGH